MRKKDIKLVKQLIKKHFLTDWEFIVNVLAPEFEEHDFDIDEVSQILGEEILKRQLNLKTNKQHVRNTTI